MSPEVAWAVLCAIYPEPFFDLQLRFARAVSALSGLSLARTVLDYTNVYIRLGLGRDFDPAQPVWREYAGGLEGTRHGPDWTYRFYTTRARPVTPPGVVAAFGCFSYARLSGDRVRLHFRNVEPAGHAPLGIDRAGQRRAELAALFAHLERTERGPVRVVGASWLYNLEAYRRLFPASYLATAAVVHGRFRSMPLWGQFLNRHGTLNEPRARQLLERLGRHSSLEGLDECFPFQVLGLEAPVREFYDFYGRGS